MLLHGEATLYTSTAAFSEPKPRRSLLQLIKDFNDKNTKTMLYGMAVRKYMESLPTEEELMEQGVIKWVSEKGTPLVVDKKANYNLALNPIINLGRYMDLLRDDVAMHAKHGKPIKSVTVHSVAKGETLYRIASIYDVSVEDLQKWNNLSSVTLKEGQRVYIGDPVGF